MQLWLCLRFADLAVQCLPQRRPQAAAVVDRQRIYAVNPAASLLGIEPGMDPGSARALAEDSSLQLLARDPGAEASALESLCCWAYGVTPHLYCFRNDCLMLEISGSLRLFGGLDAILRHCQRGLACRGFSAEHAVAATALAAWVLSHAVDNGAPHSDTADHDSHDRDPNRDRGENSSRGNNREAFDQPLRKRLDRLPLAILEPLHKQFAALQRSGLRTVGELLALPAAAIGKRCGAEFNQLLQQLTGDIITPPVHFEPPNCFVDSYPLGYPVRNQDELGPALEQLLESLDDYLRQRQLQTRQLLWHFSGPGDYRETLEVRTTEALTPRQDWYRLTRLRLERRAFSDEIELVQLRVSQLEATDPVSGSLFRDAGQTGSPGQLVDTLSNRLGSQAVSSLRCRDAHLPEHSTATVSPGVRQSSPPPATAQRPFWLLPAPEPLHRENDQLLFWGSRLELIYGPERIEDGWWARGTSRDYFVARNRQGQRFWVFHERRRQEWFIHGLFA